ncbi:DUF397 domain-containing protein (plasmid) [Streptomyces goshikiensis]|nr:DUF397 domain-containing protein [Streptomyces goshikiensis]
MYVATPATGTVAVTDGKDPAAPLLQFEPAQWAAFIGWTTSTL